MFTWKAIHTETAKRLLEFRDRQSELIHLLQEMNRAGLRTIRLTDKGADGAEMPLAEIDPFTFFANFNRGLRHENRVALWEFLKQRWQLESPVPEDFQGIPVADMRNAWFMPWAAERKPEHVPLLWEIFTQVVPMGRSRLQRETFDACLKLSGVKMGYLSMGLFWVCPDQFLATDYKNLALAEARGVRGAPRDFASYRRWLDALQPHASQGFPAFSQEAHLASARQRYVISEEVFARLHARFQERIRGFQSFENAGELESEELAYKRKGLAAIEADGGIAGARQKIAVGGAMQLRKKVASCSSNLASFHSWTANFGNDESTAAQVLNAVLDVAEVPWTGPETLNPLFAAIHEAGVMPTWDALFAALWLFRPQDYFPIKITAFRELAKQDLGTPLPEGRPTPEAFAAVRAMAEAFRERLEPWKPRDWTDVQSYIYVVCPVKEEAEDGETSPGDVETGNPPVTRMAAPFNAIFTSVEEAHAVFEQFRKAMETLALTAESGKDERVALTLPNGKPRMRFNFGNWVACTIFGVATGGERFEFACLPEERPADAVQVGSFSTFGKKTDEPGMLLVRVPVSSLGDPGFQEAFQRSMDAVRERFEGWQGSPYREYHYPELFRMIWDEAYRAQVLEEGLNGAGVPQQSEVDQSSRPTVEEVPAVAPAYGIAEALADVFLSEERLQTILNALRHKRNIVLQGAPGVGKSFVAERIAFALLGAKDRSRVKTLQFHQSYGYEDFIQGWRPNEAGGFTLRNGHFYEFCRRAQQDPDRDYVLIIDEINRGNLSRIMGELMVLLEADKRGPAFAMPLTYAPDQPFYVPERMHIIGLMNTADRSLSMVDYALRRRFAFINVEPGFESETFARVLQGRGVSAPVVEKTRARIGELNRVIREDTANLGPGYVIGHSYFVPRVQVVDGEVWYRSVIEFEILPLLQEYWVDEPSRVEEIRGRLLG